VPGTVEQPTLSRRLINISPPCRGEVLLSLRQGLAVLLVTKSSLLYKEKRLLLGGVITHYMQALSMECRATSLIRNYHLHRTTIGP